MNSVIANPTKGSIEPFVTDIKIETLSPYVPPFQRFLEPLSSTSDDLFISYYNQSHGDINGSTPECIMKYVTQTAMKTGELCFEAQDENKTHYFDKFIIDDVIDLNVGFHHK